MRSFLKLALLIVCGFFCPKTTLLAQKNTAPSIDKSMLQSLKWRNVGPFRGGRSLAVCGIADQPNVYYFGATGGGMWKTTDGGISWNSISDSTFTSSSIGCIAVAPSDPNIIYVGTGETEIRGNITYGDGMYKSTDAGKTWRKIGLEKSYAIGRIVVHPKNPNVLYVAALGKIFGKNKERGVYRSQDGGATWELVLQSTTNNKDVQNSSPSEGLGGTVTSETTGAIDVTFDPSNPSVLFASLWQCYRNNFQMSSGGEGSGLYKSVDGGSTWKNISQNPGLPVGILGRIEIAISPANSQRMWAMVENKNGGLFRSDDGGETFQQINTDKNLRQRPWYFSEICADPTNADGIFVMNVGFWRSKDGGKTFSQIQVGHGDTHDLWIDPKNSQRFILGNDGGAEVTLDGGQNWTQEDQPTAQFYHVALDNDFPYHIYGAQQDNSSIRIKSRNIDDYTIGLRDWEVVGAGESGYIAPDPTNSDIVFGGNYQGNLQRWNLKTSQQQVISPNPIQYLGAGAESMKYRFQWTYPIVFSPHDAKTLYATSQFVHKTTNNGMSWTIISPILTRNDSSTMVPSGGPITKDNTGAETFSTIFTFAESPLQKGLFWAGSDDGYLHVSKNGGQDWQKLNVVGLPDWALMSLIEPSHFDAGTAYLAANRYKLDDTKPYLFRTRDFGQTWQAITSGLPANAYCRVVREDPTHRGLLYAGTEIGIFVSFDDGEHWQPLQQNLPLVPIHDIAVQVRERDLVVATHGRAFWVLDNLAPVYELYELAKARMTAPSSPSEGRDSPSGTGKDKTNKDAQNKMNKDVQNSLPSGGLREAVTSGGQTRASLENAHLFAPEALTRTNGGSYYSPTMQIGQNAPSGLLVNYYLKTKPTDSLTMTFYGEKGDTIASFSNKRDKKGKALEINKDFYQKEKIERAGILTADAGLNTFEWDARYADATETEGTPALMWSGSVVGPKVAPGRYVVVLELGKTFVGKQLFVVQRDPNVEGTDADLVESTKFQLKVRDKLSQTHECVNQLRKLRTQVNTYTASLTDTTFKKMVEKTAKPMLDSLKSIETALIQFDAKAFQDLLALPIRLNDQLAGLGATAANSETRPTQQTYDGYEEISKKIDLQLAKMKQVVDVELPKVNQLAEGQKVPVLKVK